MVNELVLLHIKNLRTELISTLNVKLSVRSNAQEKRHDNFPKLLRT